MNHHASFESNEVREHRTEHAAKNAARVSPSAPESPPSLSDSPATTGSATSSQLLDWKLAHAELNPETPFAGSQIVPIIIGADESAVAVAQRVQEAGFDVRAIRPPTVPEGTARLRVSINALHTEEQIRALGAAVRAAMNR